MRLAASEHNTSAFFNHFAQKLLKRALTAVILLAGKTEKNAHTLICLPAAKLSCGTGDHGSVSGDRGTVSVRKKCLSGQNSACENTLELIRQKNAIEMISIEEKVNPAVVAVNCHEGRGGHGAG